MARAPKAKETAKPSPKRKPRAKAKVTGRPRKAAPVSAKVAQELIALARDGAVDSMLAKAAGVAHNTFAGWRKEAAEGRPGFSDLFDKIDRARDAADMDMVRAVRQAAQGADGGPGDWRAAKYLLSCRHAELSEQRITAREAADRAEQIEMAKLRAALKIQQEIADAQAEAAEGSDVVSALPPDAQVLAAQIVRMLMDPEQSKALRTALAGLG